MYSKDELSTAFGLGQGSANEADEQARADYDRAYRALLSEPRFQTKLFEVRDTGTTILVMATRADGQHYALHPFFRKYGYGPDSILLTRLDTGEGHVDPYDWKENPRTMRLAALFIQEHFPDLKDRQVVDVGYAWNFYDELKGPETDMAMPPDVTCHQAVRARNVAAAS